MRIFTPANLAPIRLPNPYWLGPADPDANGQPRYVWQPSFHDPLMAMGYSEAMMLYVGTLNQAPMWAGMSGDPMAVTGKLDWSKGGQCSYPPRADAVQACAGLAANPAQFQWTSKPFMPLVFDIEDNGLKDAGGNSIFNQTMYAGMGATPAQRRVVAANMQNSMRAIKTTQGGSPAGWYGFPGIDGFVKDAATQAARADWIEAMRPAAAEMDFACPSMYFSNATGAASNPGLAITNAEEVIGWIRASFPTLQDSIIFTISPAFQIMWNDPKLVHLQGQPVPLADWKRFVDYLDHQGCDALLWGDNLTWGPQYAPHCQYLAKKAG